jgi:hypothetical protein
MKLLADFMQFEIIIFYTVQRREMNLSIVPQPVRMYSRAFLKKRTIEYSTREFFLI